MRGLALVSQGNAELQESFIHKGERASTKGTLLIFIHLSLKLDDSDVEQLLSRCLVVDRSGTVTLTQSRQKRTILSHNVQELDPAKPLGSQNALTQSLLV